MLTIARTGDTASPLTVFYSLGGTATNGADYVLLSRSVDIPGGTNAAQVLVTPYDHAFTNLLRTVMLTLVASPNYTIADTDSGMVTILNNGITPVATLATADNALGSVPTAVDVWFSVPVANPSATVLGNYAVLNAPGLTITNATLTTNSDLRVVLGISGPVPANALLAVSGVQDANGNTVSNQVAIRLRLSPTNVVANLYHGATTSRTTAFSYVTDGIVNNTNNQPANGNTGFDTWGGSANATLTQFGGLIYSTLQDFQAIKVDLGKQFGDGGDWQAQPNVYILKTPLDTASARPETDGSDWLQVSAPLITGGQYQSAAWPSPGPSPNTPYVFDLTGLPPSLRAGYGWAVGGALGNGVYGFLSFSELRAYGASATSISGAPQVLLDLPGVARAAGRIAAHAVCLCRRHPAHHLSMAAQRHQPGRQRPAQRLAFKHADARRSLCRRRSHLPTGHDECRRFSPEHRLRGDPDARSTQQRCCLEPEQQQRQRHPRAGR